jgi:hypothetical protein
MDDIPDYPDDYVEALCERLAGDKAGPLLSPNDVPEAVIQKGQWRTRHGKAILGWSGRQAEAALNVMLPSGQRVNAARGFLKREWRRRADKPPLLYQWGTLNIGDNEIMFVDGATPAYNPPPIGDLPDMEADLAHDEAFTNDLKDLRFAIAAWNMLNHGDGWIHADGCEGNDYLGKDGSAWLIVGLRGLGEDVCDFKFWDSPPGELGNVLSGRVKNHLIRLGWRLRRPNEWGEQA